MATYPAVETMTASPNYGRPATDGGGRRLSGQWRPMHLFKQQRVNLACRSGFLRLRIAPAIDLARHKKSSRGATSNVADEEGIPKEEKKSECNKLKKDGVFL